MKENEGANNDELMDINKNQINPSASITLKTKIQSLSETITEISKAIQDNITDIKELKKKKMSIKQFWRKNRRYENNFGCRNK